MALDIYTLSPILVETEEHVVPNFLGGRLRVKGIIDRATNSHLGTTIDAALDKALLSIRNQVDGRSHRDPTTPAPSIRNVQGDDGKRYDLLAGGQAASQPKIQIEEHDGRIQVKGTAPNRETLLKHLRHYYKRKGRETKGLEEKVGAIIKSTRTRPPTVSLAFNLWDTDPYRAILKIACNLFALHHPNEMLGPGFDSSRRFICDGQTPDTLVPVQAIHLDIRKDGFGPLDHLVVVQIRKGDVTGTVTLYGALSFVVYIGRTSGVDDAKYSYRVDQLGRRDRKGQDTDVDVPAFEEIAARTYEEFTATATRQLHLVLPDVLAIARKLWMGRVVEDHLPSWEKVKAMSAAEKRRIASRLAAEITEGLMPEIEAASVQRRLKHRTDEGQDE